MKTYMFCNAHLDPVWLWRWESGMGEGISTFRSAANLIDEFPDFIFNHNESLIYEWVEEHEPALFERIRALVREGRWEIVGGWFLQPDCNIPSGEALLRQILRGRIYFWDKFGKKPVTAVNFDSFGHARGLAQVLRQCGYKYYVNIRPGKNTYDFPDEDFLWRGYEGSEILVHRSDKGYNSVLGKAGEELRGWTAEHADQSTALYLWGVGNHGGGPSRKDLNDIAALRTEGMELAHATPDQYFATVDREKLPCVERGLNPIMEGCYSSIIRIKQRHRRLENDLVMTEKMAAHAALAGLSTYEKDKLDEAWRDLMFSEFHDSLPGSCIQPVEEDMLRTLDHGLEIANKLKAKYFVALCAGQAPVTDGETVAIMVYNPHPFTVKGPVDVEFLLPRQMWHKKFSNPIVFHDGVRLPAQSAKESGNFNMDWCKRVIFDAELPPMRMSRFDVHFEIIDHRPVPTLAPDAIRRTITVETARGRVVVNTATGLVDSYVVDGVEYLKPGGLSVAVYSDSYNSWGGNAGGIDLEKPEGRFSRMTPGQATDFTGVKGELVQPVRVTDEGEIYTCVEADMVYQSSRLLTRYWIDKRSGALDVEIRLFFNEREKRAKLLIPTTLDTFEYHGQTMWGREKLNLLNEDSVAQYWTAVVGPERALTIVNDGVYGSMCQDGCAGITLLRGAGYGAGACEWGEPFHDPMYQPRMDQGERRYRFRIFAGERGERLSAVDNEAAAFNQLPYALAWCPPGTGVAPKSLIELDRDNVFMSCFKRGEREADAYILRVFEGQGRQTTVTIRSAQLGFEAAVPLRPFEIKTFRVKDGKIVETDILEGAVGE